MQTIKVDTPITVAKSITVKEILLEAACARFSTTSEVLLDPEGFHLEEATVYRSTALDMAPQTKIKDIEAPIVIHICPYKYTCKFLDTTMRESAP